LLLLLLCCRCGSYSKLVFKGVLKRSVSDRCIAAVTRLINMFSALGFGDQVAYGTMLLVLYVVRHSCIEALPVVGSLFIKPLGLMSNLADDVTTPFRLLWLARVAYFEHPDNGRFYSRPDAQDVRGCGVVAHAHTYPPSRRICCIVPALGVPRHW